MSHRLFLRGLMAALMLAVVCVCNVAAQQANAPQVSKAAYWSSAEPEAEVFLVEKGYGNFFLTVVSKQDLKVVYHTSINSVEPVEKELTLVGHASEGVRRYEFRHTFTKMTIWMALEFRLDGKSVPILTRTFLNDIYEVVPNEHFHFGAAKP